MTGLAWLALLAGLVVFWPASCELARLTHRVRTRRLEDLANQTAARTTDARREKP
jgi:hypothetical protein